MIEYSQLKIKLQKMNSFENHSVEDPGKNSQEENDKKNKDTRNIQCQHEVIQKMENYQNILNRIKNDEIPASMKLKSFIIGEKDFYSREKLNDLHKKIAALAEIIHDMDNEKTSFNGNSNLSHVFGNGAQLLTSLSEFKLRKKVDLSMLEEEFKNKTPQEKEALREEHWQEIKKDLSEEDIEIIRQTKEAWGLVEYYVSYLADERNIETLKEEIGNSEAGYLENLKEFYKKRRVQESSGDRLFHFRFFTRIKKGEIDLENFEDEFANLGKYSASLDKDKIQEALKNRHPF